MSTVQATVVFYIELGKFHNVDLFQRGYYQIRCHLKTNSKVNSQLDPPELVQSIRASNLDLSSTASVSSGDTSAGVACKAVSKTMHVMYKEETVPLNEIYRQRIRLEVDVLRLEKAIYESGLTLTVELWFADVEDREQICEKITSVAERQLKVHFIPSRGLYYHMPVFFDYFHLCAVELTLYGCLTEIRPSNFSIPRQSKSSSSSDNGKGQYQQTWQDVLFNFRNQSGRRHMAMTIHREVCLVLLSAYESLQKTLIEVMDRLPPHKQISVEANDCHAQLEALSAVVESQNSEDDVAQRVSRDVAKLCGYTEKLFTKFSDLVTLEPAITEHFARKTHQQRMKRLAEAFFTQEIPLAHLLAVYDPKYASRNCRTLLADDSDSDVCPDVVSPSRRTSDPTSHPCAPVVRARSGSTTGCLLRTSSSSFSSGGHENSAGLVRGSTYLQRLPPLPVECPELDGEPASLPVVFEDVFLPETEDNPDEDRISLSSLELHAVDSGLGSSQSALESTPKTSGRKMMIPRSMTIPHHRTLNSTPVEMPDKARETQVSLVGYRKLSEQAPTPVSTSGVSKRLARLERGSGKKGIALGTLSKDPVVLPTPFRFPGSRKGSKVEAPPPTSNLTKQKRNLARSMPDLLMSGKQAEKKSKKKKERLRHLELGSSLDLTNGGVPPDIPAPMVDFGEVWRGDVHSDSSSCADRSGSSSCEEEEASRRGSRQMTVFEMLKEEQYGKERRYRSARNKRDRQKEHSSLKKNISATGLYSHLSRPDLTFDRPRLVQVFSEETVTFVRLKEELKQKMSTYHGQVYSDFPNFAAQYPYFSVNVPSTFNQGIHLIVCVHGLDGNSADLRLVKTYLEISLPDQRLEFLLSERNQSDTFAEFDIMRENLVAEIIACTAAMPALPDKISFIGHSMGCVLIRAALTSPGLEHLLPSLHTFLSLSGPHLGTVYNSSNLVNVGMWVMQKWKKSSSLLQLAMRDHVDLRRTFLYELNSRPGLELFRYVLLVSSQQDRYVPYHSTRIELCKAAIKDSSDMGMVYMEMVTSLLQRLLKRSRTTVVRYDVHHSLGSSANSYIGRAAHIAVLDSEIFLEKLICVSAAKYFR